MSVGYLIPAVVFHVPRSNFFQEVELGFQVFETIGNLVIFF